MTSTHWISLSHRELKDPNNPWWAKCLCSKKNVGFSPKHDAHYCRECYAWLERHCGGETCEFCASRPLANEDAKQVDEGIKISLFRDLVQEFGPRNWFHLVRKKRLDRVRTDACLGSSAHLIQEFKQKNNNEKQSEWCQADFNPSEEFLPRFQFRPIVLPVKLSEHIEQTHGGMTDLRMMNFVPYVRRAPVWSRCA